MTRTLYNRLLRKVITRLSHSHLPDVAKESKVKYTTVYKIANRISVRPREDNVVKLANHFEIEA